MTFELTDSEIYALINVTIQRLRFLEEQDSQSPWAVREEAQLRALIFTLSNGLGKK